MSKRCGAKRGKRPGLTCRAWPVHGYRRCRMHLGSGGGSLWRRGSEADQRASLRHLKARHALWNEKRKAEGLPYPCRRKPGDAYWTAATIAFFMRRWPNSAGWKRKAAEAGALPVAMTVSDPRLAEELCLWALPMREAIKYLPAKPYLRKRSGEPNANRGRLWFTPERIADLERRFPRPDAQWRKRLAALKGETPVYEAPVAAVTMTTDAA